MKSPDHSRYFTDENPTDTKRLHSYSEQSEEMWQSGDSHPGGLAAERLQLNFMIYSSFQDGRLLLPEEF